MKLLRLYLRNFRSYEEFEVEFDDKVNLIQGGNATGKTNLLEAIFFLSTGRSFRTPHLAELIRYGQSFFHLEAHFFKEGLMQTIKVSYDGQSKKMQYNQTSYPNFTGLLGLMPTVLLAPEDVNLIMGGPQERRRFLDIHIVQIDPLYVHHLTRYFKALKQRNFLLRNRKEDAIESWEEIMKNSALYIQQKRKETVDELSKRVQMDIDRLEIRFYPSANLDYASSRKKELIVGTTLHGPHRDDLHININEKEAKSFSSQGQKRAAIAALRLAQWSHFLHVTGSPPLLSIDDFGVHLDQNRSNHLLDRLSSLGQVFLTSPDKLKCEIFQISLT